MKKSKYSIIKLDAKYAARTLHFGEYKDSQGTVHSAFDLNLLYSKEDLETNGRADMFVARDVDTVAGIAIIKG